MLAAMHVLAALGEQERPLGELAAEYERYASSGEINTRVGDQAAKIAEVKAAFPDAEVDELDGLTLQFADGSWANLRPSNTEPLLRLNVEGSTAERMAELRDAVLSRVRA
jgi:phosphomannomutase